MLARHIARTIPQSTLGFFSKKALSTKVRSFEESETWHKMTENERMNCALQESEPQSATMAYYKGLAYRKLGPSYYNEAISALQKSMELDPNTSKAAEQLREIKKTITKLNPTIEVLHPESLGATLQKTLEEAEKAKNFYSPW